MNLEILSLEEMALRLKDRRLYEVAKEIGLSYPTLKSLADNEEKNYTMETLKKVSDYLTK